MSLPAAAFRFARLRAPAVAVGLMAITCAPSPRADRAGSDRAAGALAGLPPAFDAPYELANAAGLRAVREAYGALPADAPQRAEQRSALLAEYTRRMTHDLEGDRRDDAYKTLTELLGLWSPAEFELPATRRELAPLSDALEQLRSSYARSGADEEVALLLTLAMVMHPERAAEYSDELDTVFAFADELEAAKLGVGARRARPIGILEQVVEVLPVRDPVERLHKLYVERQQEWSKRMPTVRLEIETIQAHGSGALETAWHLVRIHGRAGRLGDAVEAVRATKGVGQAPELAVALTNALGDAAGDSEWAALTQAFLTGSLKEPDKKAALAICQQGVARFPRSVGLLRMAAGLAEDEKHHLLALAYLETAYELEPDHRETAERLAEMYEWRLAAEALAERPRAAQAHLAELEEFHRRARTRWPKKPLKHNLAEAYAEMGRGLVGSGQVGEARRFLQRSLSEGVTFAALEQLGIIAFRRGEWKAAIGHFERALTVPSDSAWVEVSRNRMRLMFGQALLWTHQREAAESQWNAALAGWQSFNGKYELDPPTKGQMLVETGRLLWELGKTKQALRAFDAALGAMSVDPSTYSDVVAFLVSRGRSADAADAYHDGVGDEEVSEYSKIYMSLMLLAGGRRAGLADDPVATRYLREREGQLWQHHLAAYAVGRESDQDLYRLADTRGKRAELFFYQATLSPARNDPAAAHRLLQNVVATDMLLYVEYEMAQRLLREASP